MLARSHVFLVLTIGFAGNVAAQSPPLAAVITDVAGDVKVVNASSVERSAEVFGVIFAGEKVLLRSNATLAIAFRSDGHIEHIKGPAEITASVTGCSPSTAVIKHATRAKSTKLVLKMLKDLPKIAPGGVTLLRATHEDVDASEITPIDNSTIIELSPQFKWPKKSTAERYIWQVIAVGSDRVVAGPIEQTACEATLPQGIELEREKVYRWTVTTMPDKKRLCAGTFSVAPSEDAEEIEAWRQNSAGDTTMLACKALRFEQLEFIEDAITTYVQLVEQSPENAVFHAALAKLYSRAGRTQLASTHKDRAKELGFKLDDTSKSE